MIQKLEGKFNKKEYNAIYQKVHGPEYNAFRKAYNWKLKLQVLEAYGNTCMCCGETTIEFLTIDHVNGGGNAYRKSIGGNLYIWLRKNKFPKEGFQILCMNCNFAKGHFGYCPHKDTK